MAVSVLIVAHSPLLDAFLSRCQINVDLPVRASVCSKYTQLDCI